MKQDAADLQRDQEDILYADAAVDGASSPNGRRPLEIPADVAIPPNVRFEGFENIEAPVPRGCGFLARLADRPQIHS
jgi:hypothetical protein